MHIYNFLFCVLFSPANLVFSDETFLQYSACCTYKGPGFEDVEYDIVNRVNNKVLIVFNSTIANWTGYTPYAMEMANYFNTHPNNAIRRMIEMQTLCIDNIGAIKQFNNLTSAPTIRLNLAKNPSMLVCSAYSFFPKQIKVTWVRNGQEVTSGVSLSEVMPDGNWNYQIHSFLEHSPTIGEHFTCKIEHLGLPEPLLQVWDHSLSASERIKMALGTFLLVLGFVLMSTGFIYYKKKSGTLITLCQGRAVVPLDDLPAAGATWSKR